MKPIAIISIQIMRTQTHTQRPRTHAHTHRHTRARAHTHLWSVFSFRELTKLLHKSTKYMLHVPRLRHVVIKRNAGVTSLIPHNIYYLLKHQHWWGVYFLIAWQLMMWNVIRCLHKCCLLNKYDFTYMSRSHSHPLVALSVLSECHIRRHRKWWNCRVLINYSKTVTLHGDIHSFRWMERSVAN